MDKETALRIFREMDPVKGVLPSELMPKERSQSVTLLGILPMPYYNALRPKTEYDVFESPTCSVAVIVKEFGENHMRSFMVKILNDLLDFFSVGKTMGAVQVAQTADLIIEEYYFLKPDDFKLCFSRAKKGIYGKVYDRIDGQVIFDWLNTYEKGRGSIAENDSINASSALKSRDGVRTSSILEVKEHEFKKYDFERKFKK